jgi:hypothetical protein
MMGTQTTIDKTLGVGTKTYRIIGNNVPRRGNEPKPSSKE